MLVEVSIVLVVIGLVVGCIFVGKDLVHTAELRATVSQYEKYKAAVNTFKLKFNTLPGDLTETDAITYGFLPTNRHSDFFFPPSAHGNGVLDASSDLWDEFLLFWQDLSSAKLIDGSFTLLTDDGGGGLSAANPDSSYLPRAKLGSNVYWLVAGPGTVPSKTPCAPNCYALWEQLGAGFGVDNAALFPQDAYAIDVKLDDGVATSGTIQEWNSVYGAPANICNLGASSYPLTTYSKTCSLYLAF